MLKEFLKDLARWADDPMTQSVMAGVGVWLAFEILAAQQRKLAAQGRHLRLHGERIGRQEAETRELRHLWGELEDSVVWLRTAHPGSAGAHAAGPAHVSRETSPRDPYSVLADNA